MQKSILASEPFVLAGLALLTLAFSLLGIDVPLGGEGGIAFVLGPGFAYEYGLILCVLVLASALLRRDGRSIGGELKDLFRDCRQWSRGRSKRSAIPAGQRALFVGSVGWPVVAASLCAVLGYRFLRQPVRYDEAFTYLYFLARDWPALFYYPLPNNHFLYSLVAKLAGPLLGQQPWAWRLPALAASVASVFVLFRVCRTLSGSTGGFLATLAFVTWPILALYSTLARGYSLAVLLTLLMAAVVAAYGERVRRESVSTFALLAGLSLLTMPSMAYAVASLGLWFALVHWTCRPGWKSLFSEIVVPGFTMTCFFTALFYIPVLLVNRVSAIADNRFFAPLSPFGLLAATGAHASASWLDMTRGLNPVYVSLLALLVILGIVGAARGKHLALLLLIPACIAGAAAVFVFKGSIPFPRTWIYLVPIALVGADAGFAFVIARWSATWRRLALLAMLGSGIVFACRLAVADSFETYPDSGGAPGARAMAEHVADAVGAQDWICARPPLDLPLLYYLQNRSPATRALAGREHVFYVVPGEFPDDVVIQGRDLAAVGRSDGLTLYQLVEPYPGNGFSIGFHCWLRGNPIIGALKHPSDRRRVDLRVVDSSLPSTSGNGVTAG